MWKFAVRNLLSRPARSSLSLCGLTVAIAGMVGLFSVAEGLQDTFDRTFRRIPGLIVMQAGAPIPLFSRLPAEWAAEMDQVSGVGVVAPEIWLRANVIEGDPVLAPPRLVFGVDIPSRIKLKQGVYNDAIVSGRFLASSDRGTRSVVISRQIAEQHHKQVGDGISINGEDFQVVGIYHCGSLILDVTILVDGDTVRQLGWFDPHAVSGFYLEPDGTVPNAEIADKVTERFRGRALTGSPWISLLALAGAAPAKKTELSPWQAILQAFASSESPQAQKDGTPLAGGPEPSRDHAGSNGSNGHVNGDSKPAPAPVEVRNVSDFGERFNELSDDLNLILSVLTGIGMTVAVLSIVNTMLMSVTERVIEFGVLKANGWTPGDVLKLITIESGTLGLSGGLLGSVVGWTATQAINAHWPERVNLYASPGLLLFALAFSTIVGLVGGLYPAIWAMRLSPMQAIRRG